MHHIGQVAEQLGMPVYVVGGFVRDKILNRPTTDADIVCLGDCLTLAKAVAQQFTPVPEVNYFKNFGTAHIHTQKFDIEFVTARKESYEQHSRNPIVETGTIKDDQNRRDFTINAMAIDLNNDEIKIIDLYQGQEDLACKKIRTVGNPDDRFSEDALRMMRAIRIAAQIGFLIEDKTFESIQKNLN